MLSMKIQIELPDTLVETVVRGIMDNFPEASQGSSLHCYSWKYDAMTFGFFDEEIQKDYKLDKERLLATFPLIFSEKHWPKGCTPPPFSNDPEVWDNWLGQCDATDFDAFVQLALLGEVIYG